MSGQASGKSAESPYRGSIYSGPDDRISNELAEAIQEAEKAFDRPVWALINWNLPASNPYSEIGGKLYEELFSRREELRRSANGIALIVDSPGGLAEYAYRIATLLRHCCGPVRVLVADSAKSAGTLLALSASELYIGQEAELGPLDVQVSEDAYDPAHSALNEVQALERLHEVAIYQTILTNHELRRMIPTKRPDAFLPFILDFVSQFMRPLAEKIDTVHYTDLSRRLKVGEEYALRLLRLNYQEDRAREIARRLVNDYPSHDFVIGYEEASSFLDLAEANKEQQEVLDKLRSILRYGDDIMIGALVDVRERDAEADPPR